MLVAKQAQRDHLDFKPRRSGTYPAYHPAFQMWRWTVYSGSTTFSAPRILPPWLKVLGCRAYNRIRCHPMGMTDASALLFLLMWEEPLEWSLPHSVMLCSRSPPPRHQSFLVVLPFAGASTRGRSSITNASPVTFTIASLPSLRYWLQYPSDILTVRVYQPPPLY